MGNTDSRLGALYRDHVFKLARAEPAVGGAAAKAGSRSAAIPLFRSDVDETQLMAAYLNREPRQQHADNMFEQFYLDFISAGNGLTMELLNSKISPLDLQYIVGANRGNFANLLRFVSLKIVFIANGGRESLNTEELEAQLVQLLVCVRILTKIMPWYLAGEGDKKMKRSLDIFWTRDGDQIFGIPLAGETDLPPLGLLLVRSLVRLLFIEGFTITVRSSPGCLTHFLWENGISTQDFTYHHQSPRIDSNRLEIMNALLSICSSDLYQPKDFISEKHPTINRFLFCLTTLTPEYDLICFVASLINLICRFCSNHEDETKVPYQELGYKQNHQQHLPHLRASLVLSGLQMLNLMCFNNWNRNETFEFALHLKLQSSNDVQNPLPNICLSYLSTFNREFDLKLILTSFAKTFKLPIELAIEQESNPLSFLSKRPPSSSLINSNYNNNDSASANNNSNTETGNEANDSMGLPPVSPLLLQWLVLFTKLIQTNKFFENYVADKFACKIIVFSVYYISFYRDNPEASPALIPLCSNLALLLSSRKLVLAKTLDKLTPNYYTNKIPNFFKLSSGNINNITYRDFTLIHLCHLAIGDVRDNNQPRPWLFELIYNLLPIPSNLKDEDLIQLSFKRQSKALRHGGLSYNASMALLQLISKMSNKKYLSTFSTNGRSTRSFIASPGFKLDLLALLLRAIIIYIVVYYNEALNLIFVICRHQRVFLQLRDTIDTISKALEGNGIIEGLGKVQLQDYLEYTLNPRLLRDDLASEDRDTCNTSSTEEFNSQNIKFTKNLLGQDDTDEFESNESDDETDDDDTTMRIKKDQDLDQDALSLAKVQSAAKNTEIYEQADITDYCALSNKALFKALRPQWPVGLTSKAKAKSSATNALSTTWTGAETLQTMTRIIRIILRDYPEIATITSSDYYKLIGDISIFKDKFKNAVQKSLPVVIREMNEAEPMRIDLTEGNLVYQQWLHDIIWSDIFNTHSAPYSISQASGISLGANGHNIVKESAIEPISPTMPKLERWNSNGSAISRTNSNNSSLLSYFSNQNHDIATNSPLELTNNLHASNKPLDGARSKNMPTNNGHSFFRFSWTGFNKNEECSPIKEEEYCDGKKYGVNNSRRPAFNLDPGILKPNIWAGTQIQLFKTRRQEKEGFSLLDMTSSLFRRLKFGSTTSVSSLDTINTNPNNYATNSNNLTPVSSRPWTPRDSLNSK
ncbi:hypothetical protein HG536_0C05760 [Torulaspora globosa]|uniref:Protein HID1 n=1 Tax=Torulaspora globosa TaxID=48254 RepID=A0A7G3ZFX1_9SACH|nr:uncharacterized protein HG536_0C05760 [Torulaspora globosa]QLL32407.1 hypothetical protein HG536_0C05760 [Torulaspora globosa]